MKTRVITAIVGIIVLIGVMFTFNTLIFNLVIAAITLIALTSSSGRFQFSVEKA